MLLKGGDFDDDKLFMVMVMSNMRGGQDTTNSGIAQLLLMKGLLHVPNAPDINNINIDVE